MAHPAYAEHDQQDSGLVEYFRLGGNCIYLHDEGEGNCLSRGWTAPLNETSVR